MTRFEPIRQPGPGDNDTLSILAPPAEDCSFAPSQAELRFALGISSRPATVWLNPLDPELVMPVAARYVLTGGEQAPTSTSPDREEGFDFTAFREAQRRQISLLKEAVFVLGHAAEQSTGENFTAFQSDHPCERVARSVEVRSIHREISVGEQRLIVYEACLSLAEIKQDKPTVLELVATLAFHPRLGGMGGEGFRSAVTTLCSLYRRPPEGLTKKLLPWQSAPMPFAPLYSEGRNVPLQVLTLLDQYPGGMYGTSFIVKKLVDSEVLTANNPRERDSVVLAARLLCTLGLIQLHATEFTARDDGGCERDLVWSSHLALPIRTRINNTRLYVLEKLAESGGQMTISKLNANSPYTPKAVSKAIEYLTAMGLVTCQELPSRGSPIEVTLTQPGSQVIRPWLAVEYGKPLTDVSDLQRLWQILKY